MASQTCTAPRLGSNAEQQNPQPLHRYPGKVRAWLMHHGRSSEYKSTPCAQIVVSPSREITRRFKEVAVVYSKKPVSERKQDALPTRTCTKPASCLGVAHTTVCDVSAVAGTLLRLNMHITGGASAP